MARASSWAGNLDTIGVTLLRQIDPTLNGNNILVAQPEALIAANAFEVNPSAVGQSQSLFTWISTNGTATTFPNAVGVESGHADSVGANFYGASTGVAPGVGHVDNYDADYFYETIISAASPATIAARVVNQSFIFDSEVSSVDQNYDDYAADHNTIFVSAAGNGGPISSAATSYNGLGVGVYGASSSMGPTSNGRCKPDLTAPGGATSFSTPYVAGAAAVLVQAANRGDGGANVSAASDLRAIKALLLNGAVKPSNWTNTATHPLDLRYGAGILNVFNSWKQLSGGKQTFAETTSHVSGGVHPPGSSTNNVASLVGWDFNSITNFKVQGNYQDRIHHYYFNVPANGGNSFALTATLVWNRAAGKSSIEDLNLFLYSATSGSLVGSSISTVDNVEHLFLPKLPTGRYDLQVMKSASGVTSLNDTETYALAFEAFNLKLNVARTDNSLVLSWPVSPTGFSLQSSTNLSLPTWGNVVTPVTITNNLNVVTLSTTNAQRFFRLQRP
ncbi:MAG: hypothetical protein JWM68_3316 [Verrucomicrobiales bacterium]|nr:hypothetical protein [Verrucomicrobiales bacterium]